VGIHNRLSTNCNLILLHATPSALSVLNHWGGHTRPLIRTNSLQYQRQALSGVDVGPTYFTLILQSSVGTLDADSEVDAGL